MSKDALVVVDVQNDFIDGALGSSEAVAKMPAILDKVRSHQGPLYLTRDTHQSDYLNTQEGKNLPVEHCIEGTEGWNCPDELMDLATERNAAIYNKPTFGSMQLAQDIHEAFEAGEVDSVELIGFCTDICVISNALLIKAATPELPVKVDAACCAGVTPDKHEAALDVMKSCQVEVALHPCPLT